METILVTIFGHVIDIQRGELDELTTAADSIVRGTVEEQTLNAAALILILSKPF